MADVMNQLNVNTAVLSFEELHESSVLSAMSINCEAHLISVLNMIRDAFENTEIYSIVIGRKQQKITLIAPYYHQRLGLPIRLGEKVLFRIELPSMRFLPSTQEGVCSLENSVELINWLRFEYPKTTLVFTDLMTESPLYTAITSEKIRGYHLIYNHPAPHLFHVFRESYEVFFQEKTSKYKNQLRKKEKIFLAKFGSSYLLKEYRKVDDIQQFFDIASIINKKTYQNKLFGETVDNTPETIRSYSMLAYQGTFRSFILWHNEIPLCFILGFQGKDGKFLHQKTGFDPEWREYSPGIYCNILMLKRLYDIDRPVLLDFGSGDADYKRLFSNKSGMSTSPVLIPRSVENYFRYLIYTVSVTCNEMLVDILEKFGVKDTIKRLLRRIV